MRRGQGAVAEGPGAVMGAEQGAGQGTLPLEGRVGTGMKPSSATVEATGSGGEAARVGVAATTTCASRFVWPLSSWALKRP